MIPVGESRLLGMYIQLWRRAMEKSYGEELWRRAMEKSSQSHMTDIQKLLGEGPVNGLLSYPLVLRVYRA
jgi:hypothetical protein